MFGEDIEIINDFFAKYKETLQYSLVLNKLRNKYPKWDIEEVMYEGFKQGITSFRFLESFGLQRERDSLDDKSEIEIEIERNEKRRNAEPYVFKSDFKDL